jgi:LmbE family N-acetylglucosaminyl deacetylase
VAPLVALLFLAAPVRAQPGTSSAAPRRTILAIGAHAGDMELTSGAVLALHRSRGDRVVILHLTLGERGNPRLAPEAYGAQKRREALAVGDSLGAEVVFGPWADAELPDDEAARRWVAGVIRRVRPTNIITHWKSSIHRDHASTSAIVRDAVLLAALQGTRVEGEPHRGVRSIWYAENWEDAEGFRPYVYVGVAAEEAIGRWRRAVAIYEFARGGGGGFPYVEYYDALATVRGAEARKGRAVAFDIDESGKKRVVDSLP